MTIKNTRQAAIEVFQLRKLGEIYPADDGTQPVVDLAFGLIATAARETARSDEPVTSEFKFTDRFATWSVTVNVDPEPFPAQAV